jgi:magnesium transporter
MSDTRFFHIPAAGKHRRVDTLAEALSNVKSGGYIWVDFFNPTREELMMLVESLGIHPLAVNDCLDEDQIPKIEDYPGNTFVLFNSYRYVDKTLSVEEVDLFIGANFLITVHGHNGGEPLFFDKLEDAVRLDFENVSKGPDFLLHVILDYTVDKKFAAIEAIQEEIDVAEEKILDSVSGFHPQDLLRLRRHLLSLRKSLFHEREIMVKICRRDSPFITEKSIYHFRDIYDHLTKFFEVIEISREMITNLVEVSLSIVNNEMARMANKTNRTVSRLTLITTLFMPITLLASIGGMSEWTMMTGEKNWRIAYPMFLVLMVVIGSLNYWLLKRYEAKSDPDRE